MISTELVARAALAGARIAEFGVHHRPRVAGAPVRRATRRSSLGAFRELRSASAAELDATPVPRAWRRPPTEPPQHGGRAERAPAAGDRRPRRSPEGLRRSPRSCALAAALRLAGLGAGAPDPFYDAAVRSMGTSWHALLVGAFEPGARVAIDKPPVDLWLQVASTKLFGFTTAALALPAAIAGTLAVAAVYDLLASLFGRRAGARRRARARGAADRGHHRAQRHDGLGHGGARRRSRRR